MILLRTTAERRDYYPFGKAWENPNVAITDNRYLFNGKESQAHVGVNYLDYGARMYDPELGRWMKQDRFAEKYYSLSPYSYAAGNPVKYLDINGDSLNIAQSYRELFSRDMRSVFGDRADSFTYDQSGNLTLKETAKEFQKGLSRDQKTLFKGMRTLMDRSVSYSISYESIYTANDGQRINVDGPDAGGAMYHAIDNAIVVSPHIQGGTVLTVQPLGQATIEMNMTTGIFHEMGEVLEGTNKYRSGAVDFENRARRILDLPNRPYDVNHQPEPEFEPTPPFAP